MHWRVLTFLLFAPVLGAAREPSLETKVIGTWNIPVIDAIDRVTYKPDHSCITSSDGMGGVITLTGHWRVEGNQLITRYKDKETKDTIVKITRNELKIQLGGEDTVYTWTRIK